MNEQTQTASAEVRRSEVFDLSTEALAMIAGTKYAPTRLCKKCDRVATIMTSNPDVESFRDWWCEEHSPTNYERSFNESLAQRQTCRDRERALATLRE